MKHARRLLGVIGRPIVPYCFTLAATVGLFVLRYIPVDSILSGSLSALEFFRLPLAQFYLALLFGWVELLRRAGVLPLLVMFAALWVLYLSGPKLIEPGKVRLRAAVLIVTELLWCVLAFRILLVPSPQLALSVASLYLLVFLWLRIHMGKRKVHVA
ncbi:MAG: hypothetical protein U1A16_01655 [Patescibacteria group bacterium]|nr:hypothetical protein [Patescibacteria group bacterium]